jgi:hypothetical protein
MCTGLLLAGGSCKFSRSTSSTDASDTTVSTIATFGEDTSTIVEDTSTTEAVTSSTGRVSTTAKPTTRTTARSVTTARPAPASPHCTASAGDAFYGSSWTVNVSSTFPSASVVIDLKWGTGNAGNYSGVTDANGSFTKTQRVQPSMRGQTVSVNVTVAGKVSCHTAFTVS